MSVTPWKTYPNNTSYLIHYAHFVKPLTLQTFNIKQYRRLGTIRKIQIDDNKGNNNKIMWLVSWRLRDDPKELPSVVQLGRDLQVVEHLTGITSYHITPNYRWLRSMVWVSGKIASS